MSLASIRRAIGPGVLYAGAAIGVSHLVTSTQAGERYGFFLVWAILLAVVSKYAFHEFGPRYAAATGESLIDGYRRLGRWALGIYILVTVGTMFGIQAVVSVVTGGLLGNLAQTYLDFSFTDDGRANSFYWTVAVLGAVWVMLLVGRYPTLDLMMKLIVTALSVCTIIAVVAGATAADAALLRSTVMDMTDLAAVGFLVALMGWMPTPIDVSVWHSMWTLGRAEQTGHRPTVREARIDFNIGYLGAAGLGLVFLALGALMLHGEAYEGLPDDNAVAFATALIQTYAEALGPAIVPFIAIAAFCTMFSTTMTVTDAYPRAWRRVVEVIAGERIRRNHIGIYALCLGIVCGGAIALLAALLLEQRDALFDTIVHTAMALSFITAPLLAFINYRLITSRHTPAEARPGPAMRGFCAVSLAILVLMAGGYVAWFTMQFIVASS